MNGSKVVDTDNHSNHDTSELGNLPVKLLKDKSQYDNALETSIRMIEIYEKELESEDSTSGDNNTVLFLKKSLHDLKDNIENISQPSKIMEIVHGKVHPNLQMAFNLTLKQ
jgi:cell division protein FtsL